ncbi:adenylate kinase [Vreelandella neptunia]|uniref:Adenylate kinase n=1 Tax=Vreelandella neptunia TaxID=115551 RepID=A0ABS9S4W8_9GAMM|nr:adenylate kinase [Halomonas neptunia]MCH4811161.1 adenylate kinase [Halomonas neptunia]
MKINVVGTSGSGKSTLARQLAEALSAPCFQLDQLFWRADWKGTPDDIFFAKLEEALAASPEGWVLDGNFDRTRHIKWRDVDMVVWIDYPFLLVFCQAIKRAFKRIIRQEELWPGTGNRESFRKTFLSRDSILLWSLKTWRQNRKRYFSDMVNPRYRHIQFARLNSRREAQALISKVYSIRATLQR